MSFLKDGGQEVITGPVGMVFWKGGEYKERLKEGEYNRNIMFLCMKIEN
jgi:hypothetical protein